MSGGIRHRLEATGPRGGRQLTVLLVDGRARVRKVRVSSASLRRAGALAGCLAAIGCVACGHYVSLLRAGYENRHLREENRRLRSQMAVVEERVAHISATLDRVEQLDAALRSTVDGLREPERPPPAAAAVPEPPPGLATPSPARAADGDGPPHEIGPAEAPLASLEVEASRQESWLEELQRYFDGQRALLASSPALWPTRGFVTSDFGARLDPYTAQRMMHRGLDIATETGQPVHSPADGLVEFAGVEHGYGTVLVIDHGNGVKTRYGHLSRLFVKRGDRVRRGDRVAAVGSTGRSTGPHLHYEVRVNGAAENPRKFILQ